MKEYSILSCLLVLFACSAPKRQKDILSTNHWKIITIDSTRQSWDSKPFEWLRGFGNDAKEIHANRFKNIVAGWYFYKNPGGNMEKPWQRYELHPKADGLMFCDVNNNNLPDFIATALPHVYWFEFTGDSLHPFNVSEIGSIPETDHMNGQGYKIADVIKGGKPEVLIKGNDGVYMAEIPGNAITKDWGFIHLAATWSSEGFDVADINHDGHLDIISGDSKNPENNNDARLLFWYQNPGAKVPLWERHFIGETVMPIDRIRAADFNQDGTIEIVVTEENVKIIKPVANLWIFSLETKGKINEAWNRKHIATHYSLNSLDVGDVNRDGFLDFVTSEHKGSQLNVYLYTNTLNGGFNESVLCKDIEMHLGCKLVDMDGDGDLDIVGPAWDKKGNYSIIRNDNGTVY